LCGPLSPRVIFPGATTRVLSRGGFPHPTTDPSSLQSGPPSSGGPPRGPPYCVPTDAVPQNRAPIETWRPLSTRESFFPPSWTKFLRPPQRSPPKPGLFPLKARIQIPPSFETSKKEFGLEFPQGQHKPHRR